jgi:hypothetical protein
MKRQLYQEMGHSKRNKYDAICHLRKRIAETPEIEARAWHQHLTECYKIPIEQSLEWESQGDYSSYPVHMQDIDNYQLDFVLGTPETIYAVVPGSRDHISIYTGSFELTLAPEANFPHPELPTHLQEVFCMLPVLRYIHCNSWGVLAQISRFTSGFYASHNSPYKHAIDALSREDSLLPSTPTPEWPLQTPGVLLARLSRNNISFEMLISNENLLRASMDSMAPSGLRGMYTLEHRVTRTKTGKRRTAAWVLTYCGTQYILTPLGFRALLGGVITNDKAFSRKSLFFNADIVVIRRLQEHGFRIRW